MGHREEITLSLPADVKYAPALGAVLTALLGEERPDAYNIQLAVHEMFTNIVEHGYGNNAAQQLICRLALDSDNFTAVLQDTAAPFSPDLVGWAQPELYWETAITPQGRRHTLKNAPEPDLMQVRGRGFFLICQLMSNVTCHATKAGNEWTLLRKAL